ncbi:MAG: molecular chaperone DnaJ [bacterium]|nr:molecular chaperone DnaJ [bacterium]MDZ4345811.1 molecular chaperone DnaJ [Candidatus Binatia bacterium]
MPEDYYQTLGVDRSATKEDIKKAYRKLAHQHHPDKDGGDEEKFKEINAAYQILGDEKKRAQYDQFGSTFNQTGAGPGGFSGFEGFNINMEDMGGIGDIFDQFFGGNARTRRTVRRGRDIAIDITISFAESASGVTHDVTTRLHQKCSRCQGNGAEPGTPIKECPACHGGGTVNTTRRTMLGVFSQASVCPTCQGEGKIAEKPCAKCHGEGRALTDRTLEITIPAGIYNGQTIELNNQGEVPPHGGVAGNLYVKVHVTPDSKLTRDGLNVRSTETISFVDAALGTVIKTETLSGVKNITIPDGTQPGTAISLPRLGFPDLRGAGRGDHLITINIQIPKRLTRQQKDLLQQFKQTKKKGLFF